MDSPIWEWVFWAGVVIILYTYFGYALVIGCLARWRPRPVRKTELHLPLSLVIAAYNEESVIDKKLENSLALEWPSKNLEIVVVTDGSDDRTPELVSRYADRGVRLFHERERRGKIAALNRVVPHCNGQILVFSDANAFYAPNALEILVRSFADPAVGCVTGAKRVEASSPDCPSNGEGLYWRYEGWLKECDSRAGSAMGAIGEMFAVRRSLYVPPAEDTILDDFAVSMPLIAAGHRLVYEPDAVAWEALPSSLLSQWKRRTRIAAGGFQGIFRLRCLWSPSLTAFQYVSHRVLRWAVVPPLLIAVLVANLAIVTFQSQQATWPLYAILLAAQLGFYSAAGLGLLVSSLGRPVKWLNPILYFCVANAAALVGAIRFLLGRQQVTWESTR